MIRRVLAPLLLGVAPRFFGAALRPWARANRITGIGLAVLGRRVFWGLGVCAWAFLCEGEGTARVFARASSFLDGGDSACNGGSIHTTRPLRPTIANTLIHLIHVSL